MRYSLIICFLFLYTGASAQEITVELENFYGVDVTNGLKINLIESTSNRAVITGNSRDKVKLKVEQGILTVKNSLTHVLKEDNTIVNIYYRQLQNVEAGQNSTVEFCAPVKQDLVSLKAKEGAEIFANIEVENFNGSVVTGGNLNIIGKALKQNLDLKTGGGFKGENLVGSEVEVKVTGGGNANIHSNNYVNALVRAGGHIYIYGNPNKVDQKTTFGGTIKKIN